MRALLDFVAHKPKIKFGQQSKHDKQVYNNKTTNVVQTEYNDQEKKQTLHTWNRKSADTNKNIKFTFLS